MELVGVAQIKIKNEERSLASRPFTLLDAMLVVAAVALSSHFSILQHRRMLEETDYYNFIYFMHACKWDRLLLGYSYFVTGWVFCWLIPSSGAILLIGLRQPRPPLGELLRQPGMSAILLTSLLSVVSSFSIFHRVFILARLAGYPTRHPVGYLLEKMAGDGGLMVLSGWLVLALTGAGRPEPGWIDRTGRILGGIWIAAWVIRYFRSIYQITW